MSNTKINIPLPKIGEMLDIDVDLFDIVTDMIEITGLERDSKKGILLVDVSMTNSIIRELEDRGITDWFDLEWFKSIIKEIVDEEINSAPITVKAMISKLMQIKVDGGGDSIITFGEYVEIRDVIYAEESVMLTEFSRFVDLEDD